MTDLADLFAMTIGHNVSPGPSSWVLGACDCEPGISHCTTCDGRRAANTARRQARQYLIDAAPDLLEVVERVHALHRMETVRLRSQQCWDGDCDHDDEPDCEAAANPYDVCRHCYGNAMEIDDETARWDEVASWPCATAVALGHPPTRREMEG